MHAMVWVGFVAFILVMLVLDLVVLNRKEHVVSTREALAWTAGWVTLALLFAIPVYYIYEYDWFGFGVGITGHRGAIQYLTGWATEYSLSLDNIFVIALLFSYFRVERHHQHRVLVWGILGALVMRGLMIAGGAYLMRFHVVMYLFGAFLVFAAGKMAWAGDEKMDPEKTFIVRTARKLFPVTREFHGSRFFIRQDGRLSATPLFLVLLVVESTDVIFAVDSIPAIFGITKDPFLVFTSNVFAILGLRSLFFALAGLMDKFHYIKVGLVVILAFIGIKMLLAEVVPIADEISLGVIALTIGLSIAASIMFPGPMGVIVARNLEP